MNDSDLKNILNKLDTPAPSETSRDRALRAAQKALPTNSESGAATRAATSSAEVIPFFPWKFSVLGAACAAVAAALFFLATEPEPPAIAQQTQTPPQDPFASERQIYQEVEQLFPGQIAYIVVENGESHLQIDNTFHGARGIPLALRLSSDQETLMLTSFSGQPVEIDFEGRHYTLELLLNGQDEVILIAEDFVWTPSQPFPIEGVQARAQPLEQS